MTWTPPAHFSSGEVDSGRFNEEIIDNLLHLYENGPADLAVGGTFATTAVADQSFQRLNISPSWGDTAIASTTTDRVTVTEDGIYTIMSLARINFGGGSATRFMNLIYVDGTEIERVSHSSASSAGIYLGLDVPLTVGQYVEFYVWQNSGSPQNVGGGRWSVKRARP